MLRICAAFTIVTIAGAGQTALDQLKAYKSAPAPANQGGDKSAAPVAAGATGKYDIVGIKVGMTVRDALAALKVHSPNFRLQPDSIKYDFLPYALTYGINALPLNLDPRDTRRIPPNAEQFYFTLTMAPNQEVVSKVARVMMFAKDTAPLAQTVASDLIAKYGPPTYDAGIGTLGNGGVWDMYWVDDARGNRLRGWTQVQCNTIQTFKITHQEIPLTVYQTSELAMNPQVAKYRIENGYFNQTEFRSEECASYTMVRARLFDARSIGVTAPNLLSGMMVMIASGPLDHSATDATREYLLKAAKARDAKQTDAAKQNRPKL